MILRSVFFFVFIVFSIYSDNLLIKLDHKLGAGTAICGLNSSVLGRDNGSRQCQTDSITGFGGVATLIEALEQMWNILGIKAGTGILHFNLRVESRFLSGNRNGTALGCVLHTVFENIAQCFCCPDKISSKGFFSAVNDKRLIPKIHRNCNRFGSSGN